MFENKKQSERERKRERKRERERERERTKRVEKCLRNGKWKEVKVVLNGG